MGAPESHIGQDPAGYLSDGEMDEVWDEISVGIDIEEVWNGISADLRKGIMVDRGPGALLKLIAVALVVLTGFVPGNNREPYHSILRNEKVIINGGTEKALKPDLSDRVILTDGGNLPGENNAALAHPSVKRPGNRSIAFPGKARIGREYDAITRVPTKRAEEIYSLSQKAEPNLKANLFTTQPNMDMHVPEPVHYGLDDIKVGADLKNTGFNLQQSVAAGKMPPVGQSMNRFSIGLTVLLKNTWLLNHETFDGLRSESLTTTKLKCYPDMDIRLNYLLNNIWSIQTNGYFFSQTGQEYNGYYNGHYGIKNITLKYSMVTVSARYMVGGTGHNRFHPSLSLFAGCYFSVLDRADQKILENMENVKWEYRKTDFGIRVAGEFEIFFYKNLSIAPGVSISLGIPNISKGRHTRNGSDGLSLTLYYHFY